MSQPFIGEIRMVGFKFNPEHWSLCNGQLLNINEYSELFALIGTNYGGDGVTSFGLPDLRSRVPMHASDEYHQGKSGGAEQVVLDQQTMPSHTHSLNATADDATENLPDGHSFSNITTAKVYSEQSPTQVMSPLGVSQTGENAPHANMQPYQTVNFIISMTGIWPNRD